MPNTVIKLLMKMVVENVVANDNGSFRLARVEKSDHNSHTDPTSHKSHNPEDVTGDVIDVTGIFHLHEHTAAETAVLDLLRASVFRRALQKKVKQELTDHYPAETITPALDDLARRGCIKRLIST